MIRNKRLFMPLGLLALVLSVFLGRVGPSFLPRAAFFEGVFLGIAAVFAVAGLFARAAGHE